MPFSRRPRRARAAWALLALSVVGFGCDDGRPRRSNGHGELESPIDGSVAGSDGGALAVLGDIDPSIAVSEPHDIGTSLCPGVRLYRLDRRHVHVPATAPPLSPRFFGRTEFGQVMTFRDVLLCELRIMHWVLKFRDEGAYLILWRGPSIFEPDADCDWREPFHSERTASGRVLQFHEHCRRRSHNEPSERAVTVEVNNDYTQILER